MISFRNFALRRGERAAGLDELEPVGRVVDDDRAAHRRALGIGEHDVRGPEGRALHAVSVEYLA